MTTPIDFERPDPIALWDLFTWACAGLTVGGPSRVVGLSSEGIVFVFEPATPEGLIKAGPDGMTWRAVKTMPTGAPRRTVDEKFPEDQTYLHPERAAGRHEIWISELHAEGQVEAWIKDGFRRRVKVGPADTYASAGKVAAAYVMGATEALENLQRH